MTLSVLYNCSPATLTLLASQFISDQLTCENGMSVSRETTKRCVPVAPTLIFQRCLLYFDVIAFLPTLPEHACTHALRCVITTRVMGFPTKKHTPYCFYLVCDTVHHLPMHCTCFVCPTGLRHWRFSSHKRAGRSSTYAERCQSVCVCVCVCVGYISLLYEHVHARKGAGHIMVSTTKPICDQRD